MSTSKENRAHLFRVADAQQGYFTVQQAVEAGFGPSNTTYHVEAGNWIREIRGIYRLANYPNSDQSELVVWSLWSRNRNQLPQGVYSHQTALSIHELTDLMPSKFHLTVPPSFKRLEVPSSLVLHKGTLSSADIELRSGFSVTRALRTILDLLNLGSVPEDILRAALRDALAKGLITPYEAESNETPLLRVLLETLR